MADGLPFRLEAGHAMPSTVCPRFVHEEAYVNVPAEITSHLPADLPVVKQTSISCVYRVGIADWLIYLRKRKALRKNPGRLSMLSVSIPSCDAPRLSDATI